MANLSWRAFHFLNPSSNVKKETYDFKSTKAPPIVPELDAFKMDMYDLVKNVMMKPKHLTKHIEKKHAKYATG